MAVVHTIPPELLSLTFSSVYSDSAEDASSSLIRTSYKLLDLLLVCRRWNDIACQTPELWTTVHVAHDPDAPSRAQTYANRAGDLELDIVVTSMTKDSSTENCGIAFEHLIVSHSHRLRSITLPFSTNHIWDALSARLPSLSSFTCAPRSAYDERFLTRMSPGTFHMNTPKLQNLVLHHHAMTFLGEEWPSLRHLEYLRCDGYEEWLWGVLGASQQTLETLVLGHPLDTIVMQPLQSLYGRIKITPCTSLSNLTSLKIVGMEDADWNALRFAEMPVLTCLTVELDFFPDSEGQPGALQTFERLRYLSLATSFADDIDQALEYLLQFTPNITSLTVTDKSEKHDPDEGHLIGPLLVPSWELSEGPSFCPKLEEINLLGISTPTTKIKELVDLRLPNLRKIKVEGGRWDEGSWDRKANKAEDQALLEWIYERVQLIGLIGWWDELSEPLSLS
ncbi:hypothetical protein FRC00_005151 [Tulasnella sp. 408]|nr:hypothetical protein FRC00_005151 [Tulasnella sp. 408]